MTLRAEHLSARKSKITNDGLTESGTGYTRMATVGVKRLNIVIWLFGYSAASVKYNSVQFSSRSGAVKWRRSRGVVGAVADQFHGVACLSTGDISDDCCQRVRHSDNIDESGTC